MILKKKLFQVPYSKFKCFNFIYEDEEDLKSNLLILIKSLIKHEYIVKVFSKDEVNYYFTNYLKKHSYNNFNYEVSCELGNVIIGEKTFSGIDSDKVISNGAIQSAKLECEVGNIKVEFK